MRAQESLLGGDADGSFEIFLADIRQVSQN
jgi:hypothetical protein